MAACVYGSVGFAGGAACAGHGRCVQTAAVLPGLVTAGGGPPPEYACLCDAGFTGRSDFFDTFLGYAADGTEVSRSCPTPLVLVDAFFGAALVASGVRFLADLAALRVLVRRDPSKCSLRGVARSLPAKVLLADLPSTAICMVAPIAKIADKSRAIGTDALVSMPLAVAVMLQCTVFGLHQIDMFSALNRARVMNYELTHRSRRNFAARLLTQWMLYLGFTFILYIVVLTMDKGAGPLANGESSALIARNVGNFLAIACGIWIFAASLHEVSQLVSSVASKSSPNGSSGGGGLPGSPRADAANGSPQAGSASPTQGQALPHSPRSPRSPGGGAGGAYSPSDAVARVLSFLRLSLRQAGTSASMAGVVYVLFSVPNFWGLQAVPICLALMVVQLTLGPGANMLRSWNVVQRSAGDSPSEPRSNPKVAARRGMLGSPWSSRKNAAAGGGGGDALGGGAGSMLVSATGSPRLGAEPSSYVATTTETQHAAGGDVRYSGRHMDVSSYEPYASPSSSASFRLDAGSAGGKVGAAAAAAAAGGAGSFKASGP